MENLHLKSLIIAACIAYALGVSAFLTSSLFPILSDPELQANWVLAIAIIPASMLGARFYYRKNQEPHGLILGIAMFFMVIILDALITVPLFVIPAGGDHISFFSDPGFWLIGVEYVLAVYLYRRFQKNLHKTLTGKLSESEAQA